MPEINPLGDAKQEIEAGVKRWWHRVVDLVRAYFTGQLLGLLGLGSVAAVAAFLRLPLVAAALCAVAIVLLAIYAIYATKELKKQDREVRWAYVDGKRVRQHELSAQIAMDTVTLALLGERHAPGQFRSASPELRAALAHHQHQLSQARQRADAAEAVKDGTGSDVQRRTHRRFQQRRSDAPPKPPDAAPVKRRREVREAKRKELEAEIQSLATADDIHKAMRTEEVQGARRSRREIQAAARKADQAARDRVRAGKAPTQERGSSEAHLAVAVKPNGERDVSTRRPPRTPEEIARGDAEGEAS